MGTIVSYEVTTNYFNYKPVSYDLTIFDLHCIDKVNESTNGNYELSKTYNIKDNTMNRIKSILGNYAGIWTA